MQRIIRIGKNTGFNMKKKTGINPAGYKFKSRNHYKNNDMMNSAGSKRQINKGGDNTWDRIY